MVRVITTLLAILSVILGLGLGVESAVIQHDFDIAWVWANPDGAFARPVIGVNGHFPPPQINASVGDTVIIHAQNSLGNQSTSLHFHGLFMNGTSHMDGTTFVSQCAIQPGSTFKYKFTIDQPGTYWYHSHTKAQYPDGLRGMIVVSDPKSPYKSQYDGEITLSISDWYHQQMTELLVDFDKSGSDPAPDASLINDARDLKVRVQPGKTYLVRLANIGAFVSQYFWVEDHVMKIVEVDGVYTEAHETNMLYLAAGQRYSFLITIKEDAKTNFPMVARVDTSAYSMGNAPELEAHGWLVSDEQQPMPPRKDVKKLSIFEDTALVPWDREKLLEDVGQNISLNIGMKHANGGMIWRFNTAAYEPPEMPSMFTALGSGSNASDPYIYGTRTQPLVLDHNKVIEIALKNGHMMDHPMHLHGHNFQVLGRSTNNSDIPMRRDTILVRSSETIRIRFRADNPGVWLLHCHMEWHAHSGLMATIVEAPLALQQQPLLSKLRSQEGIHGACPGEQISDGSNDSDSAPSRVLATWQMASALGLGAALVAALTYAWYRYRARQGQEQAYSLVPLADAEDTRKQIDAGSSVSLQSQQGR